MQTALPPTREGTTATVKLVRLGNNASTVSVTWETADVTAFSTARANDECHDWQTPEGTDFVGLADYVSASGTHTFGAGEVETTLSIEVKDDNLDEGDVAERFALRLLDCDGCVLDAERTIVFVEIEDVGDPTNTSVWCQTPYPTGVRGEGAAAAPASYRPYYARATPPHYHY